MQTTGLCIILTQTIRLLGAMGDYRKEGTVAIWVMDPAGMETAGMDTAAMPTPGMETAGTETAAMPTAGMETVGMVIRIGTKCLSI